MDHQTGRRFHILTSKGGSVEITPAAAGCVLVRIRAGEAPFPPYRSQVVEESKAAAPVPLEQTEAGLKLPGLFIGLRTEPLGLSFARSSGEVFVTDVAIVAGENSVAVRQKPSAGVNVYGLGEKTGWLDKRGRRYTMRSTDVFLEHPDGIGHSTDPLYASFPVFILHSAEGSYGIFVDNTEFTQFDFTDPVTYEFSTPSPVLNYYLLPGPTLPDVLRQYTTLTGRMPLPALWTLGFHQCRWSYFSADEVRQIAAELRSRRIPADAIWLDIDYMDGYRVFTWDAKRFPQPEQLIADLAAQGLRVVTIVDPGVKVDENYIVYKEGHESGHFIRHSDGREYNGIVWPGLSAFPDFHRAETRSWWAGHIRRWLAENGIAGIWNDMNEPATTDVSGSLDDVRHAGGDLPHASARNTYGLHMALATYEGILAYAPDSRPFILTRSAFCGAQRVAALWGGDNSSAWEHLTASLPLLMNLGLSGMPFVGVDIGGFAGDATAELLVRWTQAGVFYPFCRNHSAIGTRPQEPWQFGPEVEAICRAYIELRYQLLPYIYTLFYEASQSGAPVMRPLVWHYPHDPLTFNLNDQFLLGPDLLVAPVLLPGARARAVYLPAGRWYRWESDEALTGPAHVLAEAPLERIPLFVRGGAILPMWPVAQHTGAVDRAALRLHVWPGTGSFELYEDDGLTQAYTRGACRITRFTTEEDAEGMHISWTPLASGYADERTEWTFVLHGLAGGQVTLDGRPVAAEREDNLLIVRVPDDRNAHRLNVSWGR